MKTKAKEPSRFIEVMPKGLTPTNVQPIRLYLKGERIVGIDKVLTGIYRIRN